MGAGSSLPPRVASPSVDEIGESGFVGVDGVFLGPVAEVQEELAAAGFKPGTEETIAGKIVQGPLQAGFLGVPGGAGFAVLVMGGGGFVEELVGIVDQRRLAV